ncbi:CAP domain-containing protein [Streptomyces sp. NPDC005271]|uniref:CAP domain-containing protein n=1 Tax=unclassified Streptomyces TaxID=2593676 RepID=UPI0033A5303C
MSKHRSSRTHHRKIAVAAVALAAVGVPSAAMAAQDGTSSAAPTASSAQDQVVDLVNSERGKAGCEPVKVNDQLTKAAQDHSEDMASHSNMSHTGSDGSSPGDRIERAGYSWSTYGENVAQGYSTPKSVMDGWMSSSGHKANILNCHFKEIGVGLSKSGNYWTQDFGAAR